jgi:uncharacterized protein (TIGR02145 family)
MMDRNLGATSANPGDAKSLGLYYQWGRKDPFLGASNINKYTIAKSTITWPSYVKSDSSTGTIEYSIANPTTFIGANSDNSDWYYTGSSSTDQTRWTISSSKKSIYDPCPVGWRVPDGGEAGVFIKAFGKTSSFYLTFDDINKGFNFSGELGDDTTIWYPAAGHLQQWRGDIINVGSSGEYWTASPSSYTASSNYAYDFHFYDYNGEVVSNTVYQRGCAYNVRCIKE